MKLNYLIPIMCTIILLSGCSDTMEDILSSFEKSEVKLTQTRAIIEDSVSTGEPEEFIMPGEMKRMKDIYEQLHSQRKKAPVTSMDSYDDTFWSNMYAIRELPATIKVRSKASSGSTNGYVNLYCDGKGKEVTLNNSNDATRNRFYIKVLPATTGIPYLIYSQASGTPLTVGYYTNKPDDKILMASKDNSGSSLSCGWDLLESNLHKNYYAIESQGYIGQSDPNNSWSIFYYVLEATSGNKIRYAQREYNKAQQEFIITPDKKFEIYSLEYDVNSTTVSKSTFKKTITVKNTSSQSKEINVPFNLRETETSYYNKNTWNVNLNFSNPEIKFQRPSVTSGIIISPENDSPADANFINASTQSIDRVIQYLHPIRCNPSSIATVTLDFVKYNVTVKYIAKAKYEENGDRRECVLKGTWSGSIIEDPKEIAPHETITYTPIGSGGDIILKNPTFTLYNDTLITTNPQL